VNSSSWRLSFHDVTRTVQRLSAKLQAAEKAGGANATEWLGDRPAMAMGMAMNLGANLVNSIIREPRDEPLFDVAWRPRMPTPHYPCNSCASQKDASHDRDYFALSLLSLTHVHE
jgi:hypothetical protein